MNLDPETLAGIKTALRLNPQGVSLAELATHLGVSPEALPPVLDYLSRNGEVQAKIHDQSGIYTLSQGVLARAVLRLSDEMMVLLDSSRRIIQMNDAFLEHCEGTRESLLGHGVCGVVEELMADLPVGDYLEHPEEQTPRTFIRFLQKDGKDRFFHIKMAPWPFEDGSWGVVVLIKDATAQRSAELALAESQHMFREVLQNIQDVFYRSDAQGNLVMASDSLARMLGYDSIDECIGKNAAETFYVRAEERHEMVAHLRKDGAVWDYEVLLKKKDGTPVPVSMNSHMVYSPEGEELGVEGIFRDISERKASQECIHQHVERIVELSHELLEFIDHPPRLRPLQAGR